MATIFRYKNQFIDENSNIVYGGGLIAAKNYKHAVRKMCEWYGGEEEVLSFELTELLDVIEVEEIKEELERMY